MALVSRGVVVAASKQISIPTTTALFGFRDVKHVKHIFVYVYVS